jgi:long-chain acyl-CoA synthetase
MEQHYHDKGDTWPKILKHNYETYGDRRSAMRQKHYGIWQPLTWQDYYLNVRHLALGLLSFGFEAGDKLLIIGDNAPQWYVAELAAQANHGLSVGLFSELLPSEIKRIAENSDARFAMVQDQEQVDKLLGVRDSLPLLKKIIYWNYKGLARYQDDILVGYLDILERGKAYADEHPGRFEQIVASGRADDPCAIIYTAGTTGAAPLGAVHTYRSLRAGAECLFALDPWFEKDNVVPYLPPVWIQEQWIGIGCHLLSACTLNFAETSETQQRDSRETGPSIVFYRARLWESQAAAVQARIQGADALKRMAYRLFMPLGYRMAEWRYRRQKPGLALRILNGIADILLFTSIRRSLGLSNARICHTTGAILSPEAFRFYHALQIPLKSLYGTTEGGILSGSGKDDIDVETVGSVQSEAEVDISTGGEIKYRQKGLFVGYYKDPERTAAVLQDGYFCSGDSGFVREDGRLVFQDRLRDMVTLSGGHRLAPQLMESRLRSRPHIKDAWVVSGSEAACLAAIIVINYETVSRWAGMHRVAFNSFPELAQSPDVYHLIEKEIAKINQAVPAGSRIRKFINLHKEFDPDVDEMTRTRVLRRSILEKRYRPLTEAIYGDKDVVPKMAGDASTDGRSGSMDISLRIQRIQEGAKG